MKANFIKELAAKNLKEREEKKNFIPKFIQKQKHKTVALLDCLNHRRTLTIEESQIMLKEEEYSG